MSNQKGNQSLWPSGQQNPRVVVLGAGAVGCFYGARLAEAGAQVTLIGRQSHVDAINTQGLSFESGGQTRQIPMQASTDPQVLRDADLILLCVKTLDTEDAARQIADLAPSGAVVVSLQNGVDNVERVRSATGIDALAAVVYVAASMPGPGHLRHAGRGDLILGEYFRAGSVGPGAAGAASDATSARVKRVADLFERAAVACPVSDDVRAALWVKLVVNCVFNPVSALAGVRYGVMVGDESARLLMREILDECHVVASADGVRLPDADSLYRDVIGVGQAMAAATSSTQQDLARGKHTEIDSLNGYVVRRGAALGISTPVNRSLVTLVHLRETTL